MLWTVRTLVQIRVGAYAFRVLHNKNTQSMDMSFSMCHMHTTCRTSCANNMVVFCCTYYEHTRVMWQWYGFYVCFPSYTYSLTDSYLVQLIGCVCCPSYTYTTHIGIIPKPHMFCVQCAVIAWCFTRYHTKNRQDSCTTDMIIACYLSSTSAIHIRVILEPCRYLVIFMSFLGLFIVKPNRSHTVIMQESCGYVMVIVCVS